MSKETKQAKKAAKAAAKEEKKLNKANAPKDPEMKNSVIKSVVAVICVIAVCLTATSGVGKIADAKIKAAETLAAPAGESDRVDDSGTAGDAVVPGTADVIPGDDGTVPSDTADSTDTPTDTGTQTPTGTDTPAAPSGNAASSAPKTIAEIVNYYNTATAKAAKAAVPFTKSRVTAEKNFDAGVALRASKSIVYKFMGVGEGNSFSRGPGDMDKDNYHKNFQASKLTAADVTSATCTEANGSYTIVLKIKNGTSSVSGGKVVSSNNAPLDRSGLACGAEDKDYWDHKTAENIMAAIDEVPGCGSANINESYSNAVFTVVIDKATGNIKSLVAKYDFCFKLDKVMGSSGTAEASSTVTMKDFKW